jgi:hypothetical protein
MGLALSPLVGSCFHSPYKGAVRSFTLCEEEEEGEKGEEEEEEEEEEGGKEGGYAEVNTGGTDAEEEGGVRCREELQEVEAAAGWGGVCGSTEVVVMSFKLASMAACSCCSSTSWIKLLAREDDDDDDAEAEVPFPFFSSLPAGEITF